MKIFKRFVSLGLAFLYLTLTLGFNVNMHFCQGQLVNVSLSYVVLQPDFSHDYCHTDQHSCCNEAKNACSTDHADNCCNDVFQFVHFDHDQIIINSNLLNLSPVLLSVYTIALSDLNNYESVDYIQSESINSKLSYPPPYILHHQLTYYS